MGDGINAMKKAGELQPVLILMDVGLPTLDGIEATRRTQRVSPQSNILFLTTNYCLAEDALCSGGVGFVLKSRTETDLLPAIDAVFQGKRFFSGDPREQSDEPASI